MSELERESSEAEDVSLEQALQQNWAAAGEESSTDSGDVTSDEVEATAEAEEEAGEVQESSDALEPPEKWTEEQKEVFAKLDRDAQQFLLDRHKDVESHLTKETQALSETKKRYERIDEVLKPYEEALKPRGIELAPHVANALQYYFAYQQDPSTLVKNLIQSAGLTQDQLFEDDDADPSIRALRSELQEAKREIAALKSQPTQDTSSAQRELDQFKSATNEDGSPKYPHFEQVKALMAPLVNEGKSLEDAYNEVVWTLPEHRKSQLEEERKKAAKEAEAKRQEKAKKAKQASEVMPASDVDKGNGKTEFSGWDTALKETLSQLGG